MQSLNVLPVARIPTAHLPVQNAGDMVAHTFINRLITLIALKLLHDHDIAWMKICVCEDDLMVVSEIGPDHFTGAKFVDFVLW